MITKLFYCDFSGINFCQKNLRSKNFKKKLRHQVVGAKAAEAPRMKAEEIQNCRFLIPDLNTMFNQKQIRIKSFIILAVLRRSVQQVDGAHLPVIAPRQHSFFRRNVTAVPSHWQYCVDLTGPRLKPQTSRSSDECVTA